MDMDKYNMCAHPCTPTHVLALSCGDLGAVEPRRNGQAPCGDTVLQKRNKGSLEKGLIIKLEQGKHKVNNVTLPGSKAMLTKGIVGACQMGHKSQPERTPSGQYGTASQASKQSSIGL